MYMASAGARAYNGGLGAEPLVRGAGGLKALSLFGIQWNGKTSAISVFCSLCVQWNFYKTAFRKDCS